MFHFLNNSSSKATTVQQTEKARGLHGDSVRVRYLIVACILIICIVAGSFLVHSEYKHLKQLETMKENAIIYGGVTYVPNPNIVTILFMGVDSKSALTDNTRVPSEYGQADVIMLAAVDVKSNTVKVINIPRDSMVDVTVYDVSGNYLGEKNGQVCLQYAYGLDYQSAEQFMEDVITTQILKGVKIDHHIVVDYSVIPTVVDDLGGLNVQMSDTWQIGSVVFGAGDTIPLDGSQCVDFILYRDTSVQESNFTRIARQKDFIRALMVRTKEVLKKHPTMIISVYKDLDTHMDSDLNLADLTSFANTILNADFDIAEDILVLNGDSDIGIGLDGAEHDQFHLDESDVFQTMLDVFYMPWNK